MSPRSKTKQAILGGNNLSSQSGDYTISESKTGYQFLSGIVSEIITDPIEYKEILDELSESEIKDSFKNWYAKDFLPLNTVVAYITDFSNSQNQIIRYFCFPFFSSHISLPIKAGEYVWILKESFENTENYYWLSRKHGIRQVDDLNYTNVERSDLIVNLQDQISKKKIPKTQQNKQAYTKSMSSNTFQPGLGYQSNLPDEVNFDNIVESSVSYSSEFTQEPVPIIKKKCGDTLIQGSNNSFIHLTTEKFKVADETVNNLFSETQNQFSKRQACSPAIDIGVYRKKEQLDLLKSSVGELREGNDFNSVVSNRINQDIKYHEIDKIGEMFENKKTYGNDETPLDCGARIYMSNNCSIDEIFDILIEDLEQLKGPSLAGYSENIRLITDSSLRLINKTANSFFDMDKESNVVLKSKLDSGDQFLSLKNNGIIKLHATKKIELGINNENSPSEPYVLHSELAPLLKKLAGDAAYANFILDILLQALAKIPPIGAILQPILTALETLRTARVDGAAAFSEPITIEFPPEKDENGDDIPGSEPPPIETALSLEAAGNNIMQNEFSEIVDIINNKIASTKIFGEAND